MKFSKICSVMLVFAILLASTAVALAAEKSTDIIQKSKQPEPVKKDLRVERVFISAADKPGVPFTEFLFEGGDYVLNCEVLYLAPVSVAGAAPISIRVYHKVDDGLEVQTPFILVPNEKKNVPALNYPKAHAFSLGSHKYKCSVDGAITSDSNSSNNTKSMTYTVKKALVPPGNMQKK